MVNRGGRGLGGVRLKEQDHAAVGPRRGAKDFARRSGRRGLVFGLAAGAALRLHFLHRRQNRTGAQAAAQALGENPPGAGENEKGDYERFHEHITSGFSHRLDELVNRGENGPMPACRLSVWLVLGLGALASAQGPGGPGQGRHLYGPFQCLDARLGEVDRPYIVVVTGGTRRLVAADSADAKVGDLDRVIYPGPGWISRGYEAAGFDVQAWKGHGASALLLGITRVEASETLPATPIPVLWPTVLASRPEASAASLIPWISGMLGVDTGTIEPTALWKRLLELTQADLEARVEAQLGRQRRVRAQFARHLADPASFPEGKVLAVLGPLARELARREALILDASFAGDRPDWGIAAEARALSQLGVSKDRVHALALASAGPSPTAQGNPDEPWVIHAADPRHGAEFFHEVVGVIRAQEWWTEATAAPHLRRAADLDPDTFARDTLALPGQEIERARFTLRFDDRPAGSEDLVATESEGRLHVLVRVLPEGPSVTASRFRATFDARGYLVEGVLVQPDLRIWARYWTDGHHIKSEAWKAHEYLPGQDYTLIDNHGFDGPAVTAAWTTWRRLGVPKRGERQAVGEIRLGQPNWSMVPANAIWMDQPRRPDAVALPEGVRRLQRMSKGMSGGLRSVYEIEADGRLRYAEVELPGGKLTATRD